MPICNRCERNFDVEEEPGALMFGHPLTVSEAVAVWKAHICQMCEEIIVEDCLRPPIRILEGDELAKRFGRTEPEDVDWDHKALCIRCSWEKRNEKHWGTRPLEARIDHLVRCGFDPVKAEEMECVE